jgi:CRISPR/Cas system-associated endoribonuclease Cas2
MHTKKVRLSVTVDESLYNLFKHKPNISRYIQEVLREALAEEQKDSIAKRVTEVVKRDPDFIRFIKVTCDEYVQERARGDWG